SDPDPAATRCRAIVPPRDCTNACTHPDPAEPARRTRRTQPYAGHAIASQGDARASDRYSWLGGESITRATHGLDQYIQPERFQRFAQAPDVHVHRAFLDVHAAAPDLVQQLRARIGALGVAHEKVQQPIFGGADLDLGFARVHAVRGTIDPQAAAFDRARAAIGLDAPQHRLDPRDQLACREWFDHVVIDAGLEAVDAIHFLAPRGQHDDRHLGGAFLAAQATRQFQPSHADRAGRGSGS